MLNKIAHQKLATENPGTMASARSINRALITSKNNPSVRIVIGKVNTTKIGFTIICNNAITKATKTAVP